MKVKIITQVNSKNAHYITQEINLEARVMAHMVKVLAWHAQGPGFELQ